VARWRFGLTAMRAFAARREIKRLFAAAASNDWNPSHFPRTSAEMSLAFAIGYDWLYAQFTPDGTRHCSGRRCSSSSLIHSERA